VIVVPAPSSNPAIESQTLAPIKALIIDRQPLFLAALASLLEAPPICADVVTASRSDVGLEMARSSPVHVVLCELHAHPLSGIDVVRRLHEEGVEVPVMLLGDDGDEGQLVAALGMNVAAAFSKNSVLGEFLVGVRTVLSGHRAIGAGLLVELLEKPLPSRGTDSRQNAGQLSPTELAILAMIGQAHSIPAIAASRGISHKTVRNHLAKIYRKLELHGRTEAMLWAARMGLTES